MDIFTKSSLSFLVNNPIADISVVEKIVYVTFHQSHHTSVYVLGTVGEIVLHTERALLVVDVKRLIEDCYALFDEREGYLYSAVFGALYPRADHDASLFKV